MNRRRWLAAAIVLVLGALNVAGIAMLVDSRTTPEATSPNFTLLPAEGSASTSDDRDRPSKPRHASEGASRPRPREDIELVAATGTARSGETVRMRGRYAGGTAGTRLVVQRRLDGAWEDFPLPTVLFPSGRFLTYVQLTAPGRYLVRVTDPVTSRVSNAVPLRVASGR
jgi:hypothetical protein